MSLLHVSSCYSLDVNLPLSIIFSLYEMTNKVTENITSIITIYISNKVTFKHSKT